MDKDTFLQLFTNEAAAPDPAFLAGLRQKVIGIANGTVPPPAGGMPTPLIVAIAVTVAVIGATAFGVLHKSTPQQAAPAPTLTTTKYTSADVLAAGTQTTRQIAGADDTVLATDGTSSQPTTTTTATGNTNDSQQLATPAQDDSSPTDSIVVAPDQNYFVEFWTVPLFKLSPTIPSTPADLTQSGAENLNYNWAENSPGGGVTKNHFVARATATKYLAPGKYVLDITADDGIRVYIDGVLIHDRWITTPGGTHESVPFTVATGSESTTIVIEYFEFQESARLAVDLQQL